MFEADAAQTYPSQVRLGSLCRQGHFRPSPSKEAPIIPNEFRHEAHTHNLQNSVKLGRPTHMHTTSKPRATWVRIRTKPLNTSESMVQGHAKRRPPA